MKSQTRCRSWSMADSQQTGGVSFIKSGAEAILLKLKGNVTPEAVEVVSQTKDLQDLIARWTPDTSVEEKTQTNDKLVELFKRAMGMK